MGLSNSKNNNKIHPDKKNKDKKNKDTSKTSNSDHKSKSSTGTDNRGDSMSASHSSSFFFIDPNIPDHQGQLVESTEGVKKMILRVLILIIRKVLMILNLLV